MARNNRIVQNLRRPRSSTRQSGGLADSAAPQDLGKVSALPFNLQPGETEALALALEIPGSLLLVDDAQGPKAAAALGIAYTGTLGVLLRAKAEGKIPALKPVLGLLAARTTFWLSPAVESAALKQAGKS